MSGPDLCAKCGESVEAPWFDCKCGKAQGDKLKAFMTDFAPEWWAEKDAEIAKLRADLAAETRRREFMQMHGRYLGWGIIGSLEVGKPPSDYGVMFTDTDGRGLYQPFHAEESYRDHGWTGIDSGAPSREVRQATERAVIDKAIAALGMADEDSFAQAITPESTIVG